MAVKVSVYKNNKMKKRFSKGVVGVTWVSSGFENIKYN